MIFLILFHIFFSYTLIIDLSKSKWEKMQLSGLPDKQWDKLHQIEKTDELEFKVEARYPQINGRFPDMWGLRREKDKLSAIIKLILFTV